MREMLFCIGIFVVGFLTELSWAALPSGGEVKIGTATISSSGATMTINQSSRSTTLYVWDNFSIGAGETVVFNQPTTDSIAVNQIVTSNASQIAGNLQANGRIFLINPHGITFSNTASVNVGSFVASTLHMREANYIDNRFKFTGTSTEAVDNQGAITVGTGQILALIANDINNSGTLTAPLGNVLLGAGGRVWIDSQNTKGKMKIDVKEDIYDVQMEGNISNAGTIRANGGLVTLTVQTKEDTIKTVINQTGLIEAQTLASGEKGSIYILGGMSYDQINVKGTLDASAPSGGDGGYIETSAAKVNIGPTLTMTATATAGTNGTWLIDPYDFRIACTGDMTGETLSTALAAGNVIISTLAGSVSCSGANCGSGNATGNGDIYVNDAVTWSQNKLTLSAWNNIFFNTAITGSGTATLALEYGQEKTEVGNSARYYIRAPIHLPEGAGNFTQKKGSDGTTYSYTVLSSLGTAGSTSTTDLQGMEGDLSLHYALGANIDASATTDWNAGAGFAPIGAADYIGHFDGLGHTISNLYISRAGTPFIGLFARGTGGAGSFNHIGLTSVNITGGDDVGALIGYSENPISESYSTGTITGLNRVGGIVGQTTGAVLDRNYSESAVNGDGEVAGLVGSNNSTVSDSYATGNIASSNQTVGGLVGSNQGSGIVTNSYSSGAVSGTWNIGGLIGWAAGGTASNSFWDTQSSGQGASAGGFGKTTAEMKTFTTFTEATWSTGTWGMAADPNNNYPYLLDLFTTTFVACPRAFDTRFLSDRKFLGVRGLTHREKPVSFEGKGGVKSVHLLDMTPSSLSFVQRKPGLVSGFSHENILGRRSSSPIAVFIKNDIHSQNVFKSMGL
jgi:filamentous hemagglutinin family protein